MSTAVDVDAGPLDPAFSTLALQIDGASDVVRLGDLTLTTGSISMWIQTTGDGFLFSKAQPGAMVAGELRLSIANGRLRLRITDQAVQEIRSQVVVSDGRWHHVLVTFNPGMSTFVDGVEQGRRDGIATGMTLTGVQVVLGRDHAEQVRYPYTGLMDEVALFDRILSADEVLKIHNAGVPGDLLGDASLPPPAHWWRMGEEGNPSVVTDSAGSGHGTFDRYRREE